MSDKKQRDVFQRSRWRIIAVLMAVFLFLFGGTLAAVYIVSYRELYQQNQDMLDIYIEQYWENGNPSERSGAPERPAKDNDVSQDNTRFLLASFYSVAFDTNGNAFSVDLGSGTLYTESQLIASSEKLLQSSDNHGTSEQFVYSISQEDGYTLVVLMDNTLASDSFTTLFRNILLLGTIMVLLLFFCVVALARWIIRPLEENDRMQRQFISDAGHELKTPVSVIHANTELLGREIGENKWLENIRSENNRMERLVRQLLTLVRTERETLQMEPVDLSRVTLGGALPFESIAFESGLRMEFHIEDGIVVWGNADYLGQLIAILTDNALSHSSKEGVISISLHKQNKSDAVLRISNPGFIPEEQREQIFARFFKSDQTRSDSSHYGLGLSIAKNIVREHGGTIDISCQNNTVTFSVRLSLCKRKSC